MDIENIPVSFIREKIKDLSDYIEENESKTTLIPYAKFQMKVLEGIILDWQEKCEE